MPQTSPTNGFAVPVLYLLLAAVAAWVQWNKWQALHHTRNLIALLLAVLALTIATTYLLRALQTKRDAGQ